MSLDRLGGMVQPNSPSAEVFASQYKEFLEAVAKPLKIDRQARREFRGIHPMYFLPWTMAAFSGEEYVSNIPTDNPHFRNDFKDAPNALSHLGAKVHSPRGPEFDMRHGKLTRAVGQLAKRAERFDDAAESFAAVSTASADLAHTFMQHTLSTSSAFGRSGIPRTPGIRIRNADGLPAIEIPQGRNHDDLLFPLNRTLGHVATMGPGLTGANFARDMRGANTTAVHYLSGGLGAQFINRLIERQLEDTPDPESQLPARHYYKDGIARGMQQLGEDPAVQRQGLDLVVMSAVHHAGVEECLAGVAGARELLRPGGLMAVKAPVHSPGHFAGFDSMIDTMNDGFKLIAGGPLPGARLLSPRVPGQPQEQLPSSYAILQKQ